jgi:hypothetical protein
MFPGVDSSMVHRAHLFVLLVDAQAGLYWQWWWWSCEMAPNFLSTVWHGEAFHGLGVQDVESLILIDALFLLDGGRRRKRKNEKKNGLGVGWFSWGWTCFAG